MSEGKSDVIVIGAGHNGLSAAITMADAGYSVLVLESTMTVGGCAVTTEPLVKGFKHNPHANSLIFCDVMPKNLAPATLGVETIKPEAQFGITFANGRPPAILHRPSDWKKTFASLSAYSNADAATYRKLKARSNKLSQLLQSGLYDPPDKRWFERQIESAKQVYKGIVDVRSLGSGSVRTLVDSLVQSREIRMLLYLLAIETGVALEEPGGDLAFLCYSLWIVGRWRIPVGGMGAYSDGLHLAARERGVQVVCGSPARRILLTKGKISGVETVSGHQYKAAKAVISAAPLLTTFDGFLSKNQFSPTEHAEVEAFRSQHPTAISTSFFCIDEAPDYKSAVHDGDINHCLKTVIGFESPEDVIKHHRNLIGGRLSKPAGVARVQSLWDANQAPDGKHVAAIDSAFPPLTTMERSEWEMVENAYPAALHQRWSDYVTNAPFPCIAHKCDLQSPFERRMVVRMGPDQYRSSIEGLYLAGPGIYPGGGVHGACGLNAANVLINDVSL